MSSEYRYATFYHNLDIVALHARCVVCLYSIYCAFVSRVCAYGVLCDVSCVRARRRMSIAQLSTLNAE